MQKFYKGRTNNHLTWVMVDSTDFATPESAMSAATKIKIYGKLRGGTGVNFVSSGTGSLTNDIVHVGASVLGIYTIALAKADLSDASAAWYDQYIVSLSATGAAYQTLVVDGGIDDSNLSAIVSDLTSAVLLVQSTASDAASAAQQANSRVLVAQSFLSDIRSHVSDLQSDFQSRVPKLVATNSQLSDLASDVKSAVGAITVTLTASDISDIASAVAATAGTLSASEISDIASAVWAHTVGARVDSRVLVAQSYLSDIRSHVSDLQSDFQSRVPKAVATQSKLSDVESNLLSLLTTTGVQLNASSLSDVRSAVAAVTATLGASDLSDIRSAITAAASDLRSLISTTGPTISDIGSAVWADPAALLVSSRVSDLQSKLSDVESNLLSVLGTTGVQLNASSLSDLRSAITAGATGLDASALSDIASAVVAAIGATGVALDASTISDLRSAITAAAVTASDMSDIASRVDVLLASRLSDILSAAQQTNSRVLVNQSRVSDIYSLVSDLQSDFQSRVPKAVATNSQLSDLHSDLRSVVVANNASGIASDIYSLLSDFVSDFGSAIAEPTGPPAAAATIKQALAWNHALNRNKITQTATVQSLRNDADSADIASAAVSDDGTTFTRGEWS